MRAAVNERYGPPEVVEVKEVPTPVAGAGEILIRGHASAVNAADYRMRSLDVPKGLEIPVRLAMGLSRPRHTILGVEMAGEVVAVGAGVTAWKTGDRVVASRGFSFGGHAEYMTVAADGAVARVPDGVSYGDAMAVLFGGATVLDFFGTANAWSGQSILVNGASGAVGTMAVQIARHLGLIVTAVTSTRNVALVSDLGAQNVIDYTREDPSTAGRSYDLVMDNHGSLPFAKAKTLLKPGGRFLMVMAGMKDLLVGGFNKTIVAAGSGKPPVVRQRFETLMDLLASGAIRPVIDSTYPLAGIVEAHRRVATGHKVGSVIVTLE